MISKQYKAKPIPKRKFIRQDEIRMKNTPIQVLIADDEPILRRSLCRTISQCSDIELAGQADSGRSAVEFLQHNPLPDVILMDIEMESSDDGLQAAAVISKSFPQVSIIMLTVREDEQTIYDSYCIPAVKDYVVKSFRPDAILTAIRRVAEDSQAILSANEKLRYEFQRLKKNEQSFLQALELFSRLTPTERTILSLKMQGMSTRQIAQSRMVEEGTIKAQINNMLKKFSVHKTSEIIDLIHSLKLENLF